MSNPFDVDATRRSVHATLDDGLQAIPPGHRSALLIDATNERVQVLLAIKAGESWTIVGGAEYDGAHVAGRVALMWSGA